MRVILRPVSVFSKWRPEKSTIYRPTSMTAFHSGDIVVKRSHEGMDVERPENFPRPARDFVGADAVVTSSSASSSSSSLLGQSRQRSGQALSRGYCYVLGYKRNFHSFVRKILPVLRDTLTRSFALSRLVLPAQLEIRSQFCPS